MNGRRRSRPARAWRFLGLPLLAIAVCEAGDGSGGRRMPRAAAAAVNAVEVGHGVSADKRIDEPGNEFFPEDPVYVSITTTGDDAISLSARFILEDGRVVHDDRQEIVPDGLAISEFHVQNPAGWPAGTHRVEIYLDGQFQGSRTFMVKERGISG